MTTSPGFACSFITPINCPCVSTAFVTGESGSVDLSNKVSGLIAAASVAAQRSVLAAIFVDQSLFTLWPVSAAFNSASESLASAKIAVAPCLIASCSVIFIEANFTSGFWNIDCDPVAKSVKRVPILKIKSASATSLLVSGDPSRPSPIKCQAPGF